MDSVHRRPDWMGGAVGILTFLFGVGCLVFTFYLAFQKFSVEPAQALGVQPNSTVDLAKTGQSFAGVLRDILLLFVMSIVGSVIANRGIKLYAESRMSHPPATPKPKASETHQPVEIAS